MNRSLENINIVLTRAKDQSVETISRLTGLGANVISFPTIKISTICGDNYLDDTIRNINSFNSIIFTSENAVKSLLIKIQELDVLFDPKAFFIISIGEKTSNYCMQNGFRVDFQPKYSSSSMLIDELKTMDLVGRKIFIPTSTLSDHNQFSSLEKFGAAIHPYSVYSNTVNDENSLQEEIVKLSKTNVDLFIFTSPSTFNGFIEILNIEEPQKYFKNKKTAVIGPITEKAVKEAGIVPTIVPNNFSMNYLINEIINHYSNITELKD